MCSKVLCGRTTSFLCHPVSQHLQCFWCPAKSIYKSLSGFSFWLGMAAPTSTWQAEGGGQEHKVCFRDTARLPPKPTGGAKPVERFPCKHEDLTSILRNHGKSRCGLSACNASTGGGSRGLVASQSSPAGQFQDREREGEERKQMVFKNHSIRTSPNAPMPTLSHSLFHTLP